MVNTFVERVTGIEPVLKPWEGLVLPLYDTRERLVTYFVAGAGVGGVAEVSGGVD